MLDRRVIRDLERQVDVPHVYTRAADLAAYAYDSWGASGDRHPPDAVVFPASTGEVAGVVEVCAFHGVPVIPRGAGTGYAAGATPREDGGVVLSLARMNRILGLEPDALRLQAEAGVITRAIHEKAGGAGLYYPPDPGSSSTCTIGGNVACNAAGPHTLRYGTTADFVAGLTAVCADGKVIRLGESGQDGADLLALISGSEGTLVVITEVLLRLLPAPTQRATLAATFSSMERAAAAVAEIASAGIVPAAIEFLDSGALNAIRRASGGSLGGDAAALVIIEVEGDAATVGAEAAAVHAAASRAGASGIQQAADPAEAARLWAARKAVSAAVAKVMIGKVNEDVVVPRDRIAELVGFTTDLGYHHQLPVVNFGHLGDGNLHATFLIDPRVPGERERADRAAADLFEMVLGMGGSLSGEHGVGQAKLPYVERQLGPGGVELMRRIKASFDPRGILNPGKKIPAAATT